MNGLVAQYMAAKSSAPRINPVIQNASPAAFTKQQAPVVKPTNIQPTTLNVREIDPYSDLRARERFQEGITSTAFENDRLDSRALFNANRADYLQERADSQQNLRQTNEQNFRADESQKSRDFQLSTDIAKLRSGLEKMSLENKLALDRQQTKFNNDQTLEKTRNQNNLNIYGSFEEKTKNEEKARDDNALNKLALLDQEDMLARQRSIDSHSLALEEMQIQMEAKLDVIEFEINQKELAEEKKLKLKKEKEKELTAQYAPITNAISREQDWINGDRRAELEKARDSFVRTLSFDNAWLQSAGIAKTGTKYFYIENGVTTDQPVDINVVDAKARDAFSRDLKMQDAFKGSRQYMEIIRKDQNLHQATQSAIQLMLKTGAGYAGPQPTVPVVPVSPNSQLFKYIQNKNQGPLPNAVIPTP